MQIQGSLSPIYTNVISTSADNSTEDSQENKAHSQKEKEENSNELTQEEQLQVDKLQARDTEVRAHESAHQAAGGGMTGAASFTYQQGPDGKMYAIGGEVSITFKTGATPEETIANAQQVIAAAMAPADPSPQDHAVAANAHLMLMKAQQELTKEAQEKSQNVQTYKENQEENKQKSFDISA